MSSNQQALLMSGGGALSPPVQTCVGDPYYAQSTEFPQGTDALYADTVLWFQAEDPTGRGQFIDNSSYANSVANEASFTASNIDYGVKNQGLSSHYGSVVTLRVPDAAHLRMETSDFFVVAQLYVTSLFSENNVAFIFGQNDATAASGRWAVALTGTNYFVGSSLNSRVQFYYNGSAIVTSSTTYARNAWLELAVSCSGGTLRLFLNGTLIATVGRPASLAAATGWSIRGNSGSLLSFTGWLDNLRVIKGQAVYTASYTPAALPTGQFGLTQLSLHGAAIADSSANTKTITNFGVSVSTAPSRFGGSSLSFDGSSYLKATPIAAFAFLAIPYTVETWVYPTSLSTDRVIFSICANDAADFAAITLTVLSTGAVRVSVRATTGAALISATSTAGAVVINSWANVAFSRSGANAYLFVGGILVASSSSWVNYPSASLLHVGVGGSGNGNTSAGSRFAGFIDDLRVTSGVARYVEAFTPPSLTFCDSVNSQFTGQVNGSGPVSGQVVATQTGAMRVLNPWVRLEGQQITTAQGNATSILPNKTAALLGQLFFVDQGIAQTSNRTGILAGAAVTVGQGAITVPPYPNLINVGTSSLSTTGPITARVTTTLFTDGRLTVTNPSGVIIIDSQWIDRSNPNYTISNISHQYQVSRVSNLTTANLVYDAVPRNLGTLFSVEVVVPGRFTSFFNFQIIVVPTSTNPRFGDSSYYGVIQIQGTLRGT